MKRLLLATIVLLCASSIGWARQSAADAPATKEDIQRYLDVMHSREMMSQMVEVMIKPMHQMMYEQYEKNRDKLPSDFEARMNKRMDDELKDFPWDEILQAMVPVYQRHFTKGDVDNLVTFYSTGTGQKLLRETPAIVGESMQAMMPIMRKKIEAMQQRMEQQTTEMINNSENKPGQNPPGSNN